MPQLHVLSCPSCGAHLSYEAGTEPTLTCPYCGSQVVVPAELRAPGASPTSTDTATQDANKLAEVRQLARNGWKAEAIRLYCDTFGAGLDEARQAVEAIAAESQPLEPSTSAQTQPAHHGRPDRQQSTARSGRPRGCVTGLGVLAGLAIFVFVMGMVCSVPFRLSGSYTQALEAAHNSPDVTELFGGHVEPSWLPIMGDLSCDSSCSADYSIPVHSARKTGYIDVYSYSRGAGLFNEGTWVLDARAVVDGGSSVQLTQPPPSAPTPSSVQLSATREAIEQATLDARATLKAQATATAQAEKARAAQQTATTAAQTQATAQAADTARALISAQADWTSVLTESFADNGRGWPVGIMQDEYNAITSSITNGSYLWTLTSKKGNSYQNLLPMRGVSLTDFGAAVTVRFVRGQPGDDYAYGLVFRHVNDDYGFFGLRNDGHYRVLVVYNTGIYQHYEMSSASIRNGIGQTNRIAVVAKGQDVIFLINDQAVWQINMDPTQGEVGLGVDVMVTGPTAQVEFSDLDVHAPAGIGR